MFKKIVMFLACALIGIAALTPAQAAGQDTQKKEVEAVANKFFTATTLDALMELEPYCAPGYVEYLNGQQIGNKDMFPIIKKLVKAVKLNNAEELSKTMVSFFTNDLTWKSMLALMGAADPSMQASDEELQALRQMLITMFQSMSSQQKEMMLQKMKETLKNMENQRTIFFKNTKITGTKIEGNTAVVTAEAKVTGETDPEVAAILGNKVGYELTLKKIGKQWKVLTNKTNFKQ